MRTQTNGTARLRRFALLACASLAALGGAEGLLRAYGFRPWTPETLLPVVDPPSGYYRVDPELGYTQGPGRFRVTLPSGGSFTVTHDARGRRVTGGGRTDPAKTVWIFGGSYTHGWSVDDDDAFPSQLQRLLPEWRVVNFGVGGYGTLQSLLLLERALSAEPAPDQVVFAYASFHDRRNTFLRARRKALATGNFIRAEAFPYARMVGDSLQRGSEILRYRPWPGMGHSSLVNLAETAVNRLEEIVAGSHRASVELALQAHQLAVRHGSDFTLAGITRDSRTARTLRDARERRVATVDISTDLSLPGARNRPHSGHPSAASHRRYAEALAAYLESAAPDDG